MKKFCMMAAVFVVASLTAQGDELQSSATTGFDSDFEAMYIVPGEPRPPRYPDPGRPPSYPDPGRPPRYPDPGRPNPPVPPPHRPYPPPNPGYDYICWAENQWGDSYYAYGYFADLTQDRAMDECYYYNRVCYPLGCERNW
ncbi:MAG: hypothetical protein IT288_03845 [Bdellovibrionales bacterium]|nr:hypothetical protein [Bdellovibrionales bacterium]